MEHTLRYRQVFAFLGLAKDGARFDQRVSLRVDILRRLTSIKICGVNRRLWRWGNGAIKGERFLKSRSVHICDVSEPYKPGNMGAG